MRPKTNSSRKGRGKCNGGCQTYSYPYRREQIIVSLGPKKMTQTWHKPHSLEISVCVIFVSSFVGPKTAPWRPSWQLVDSLWSRLGAFASLWAPFGPRKDDTNMTQTCLSRDPCLYHLCVIFLVLKRAPGEAFLTEIEDIYNTNSHQRFDFLVPA